MTMYIYIPWWSPFHTILSFLLVNSADKMVVKPRDPPKTCRLRLGNCSHVRWWGWRRLAHLDSEIWLDLWDAISPMGSIWPWSSWKKWAIHGNSYTVGGQVRLLRIMFTIKFTAESPALTGYIQSSDFSIPDGSEVKKTGSRTWLTPSGPMFVPWLSGRKLCGNRIIKWWRHGMVGQHWSSRLGSKPFAEISPKALTASGKTGWKTRDMSMAELRSPWCSRSING